METLDAKEAAGEVRTALKSLDAAVSQLQDIASAIIENTQTVCRSAAPIETDPEPDKESACVVSGQIHTLTRRVNDVKDQLNDVLSRMEL